MGRAVDEEVEVEEDMRCDYVSGEFWTSSARHSLFAPFKDTHYSSRLDILTLLWTGPQIGLNNFKHSSNRSKLYLTTYLTIAPGESRGTVLAATGELCMGIFTRGQGT